MAGLSGFHLLVLGGQILQSNRHDSSRLYRPCRGQHETAEPLLLHVAPLRFLDLVMVQSPHRDTI
jgi:hypothetical protein